MSEIRIVQLLCPSRHCLAAVLYPRPEKSFDEAVAMIRRMCAEARLNPWCAICGSREAVFEDAPTKFTSVEEAEPHFLRTAQDQAKSRLLLEALGKTIGSQDARHRN